MWNTHWRTVLLAAAVAAAPGMASAQNYPVRAVKIMAGFAAGGATDVTARMISGKLSEQLGQPVVVENRAGSGGLIATDIVAKSQPDGYTLLLMPAADAAQPAMRAKLPYDLERDFSPISLIVTGPWVVVVHPSVPVRSIRDLVNLARSQPGKLNYATSGVGSSAHIATELFNAMAKISITHVPYKGVSEGVTATAMGQTDVIFASITSALPMLEAKKVRPIAISTKNRSALMPDMPTVHESGVPDYDRAGWYGLIGPANLPRDIVMRLNGVIAKVVPEMTDAFKRQGLEPKTLSPEQFGAFIKNEIAQNIRVARNAGIKPE